MSGQIAVFTEPVPWRHRFARDLTLLNLSSGARMTQPERAGEGSIIGVVGLGDVLVVSIAAEGDHWIEGRAVTGETVPLGVTLPSMGSDGFLGYLAAVGSDGLAAFVVNPDWRNDVPEEMVVIDLGTGAEVLRTAVPGSDGRHADVRDVDAGAGAIVATLWTYREGTLGVRAFAYDLGGATWSEIPLPPVERASVKVVD